MPPEFRKFIDDYVTTQVAHFPQIQPMYQKLFKAEKLGVMHVATKAYCAKCYNVRCTAGRQDEMATGK